MNELVNYNGNNPFRIFDYKNLGSVRIVVDKNNEVWFCLIDVCRILEINHVATVVNRLNPDGVVNNHSVDTLGRRQELTFINEPNLYETIFKSRKPEAEDLKRWVFTNVLPSIRKTGRYDINDDDSLSLTTKAIIAHDRRIKTLEENYINLNNQNILIEDKIDYIKTELGAQNIRQTELEDRQVHLIEEGYHAILRFAQYYGINTTEQDRQRLGRKATMLCRQRGIPMGQEPAGRFVAHTYPYPILVEVFQDFVSENKN